MIEQAKFDYYPLGEGCEKQIKTIEDAAEKQRKRIQDAAEKQKKVFTKYKHK